jgi:hypothetical protein
MDPILDHLDTCRHRHDSLIHQVDQKFFTRFLYDAQFVGHTHSGLTIAGLENNLDTVVR